MAQATAIGWTDMTWNPVHGCSKVSTGCKNCYAETLSLRYGHTTAPWTARNAEQNVMLKPHKLREPLSKAKPWDQPCMVFVNSMSDLFHEQIPYEYIGRVFRVMEKASRHTFQVLTKRPERMAEAMADLYACGLGFGEPLPNVWLGVSIENRKWVGRADVLRATPAAVRFISAEPLLGPLYMPWVEREVCEVDGRTYLASQVSGTVDRTWFEERLEWADDFEGPELDLADIDWLIVGGESGAGHRPMQTQWATDLREAAKAQGTAFFMKQAGGPRPGTAMEDLPEGLRVREFPRARVAT